MRGLHVRRDHALLDQPVGIIALPQADLLDAPMAAEFDLRLRQLQVQRPTFGAGLCETPENSVQVVDLGQHRAQLAAGIGASPSRAACTSS